MVEGEHLVVQCEAEVWRVQRVVEAAGDVLDETYGVVGKEADGSAQKARKSGRIYEGCAPDDGTQQVARVALDKLLLTCVWPRSIFQLGAVAHGPEEEAWPATHEGITGESFASFDALEQERVA